MVDLFYDCYCVLGKVYSDGAYISQAILTTPIEPLNKAKTVKICYGVLDKDIYLDYCIDYLCERSPKQKIRLLLKIAMYALKFLEKKPFAVIDSIVELTKKLGKGVNAGFINAVLRKFCNTDIPLPEDRIKFLSVKYSFPEFAVKKLIDDYNEAMAVYIMSFDEEKTFVRFNDETDGVKYLSEHGYKYTDTPFENLFAVEKIARNEDFDKGVFTFQSIGSVAICDAVGGGKKLLDACAAPGGKSVLLSKSFENVTACELHPHRAELIKSYCERMHVSNVEVVNADSSVYNEDFEKRFDTVLCDVPCSGYGTVKTNPDIKLNRSEADFIKIIKTQEDILKNCANYVSENGVLMYSTCSFFKDENDGVVERFLTGNDCFESEEISTRLSNFRTPFGVQFLPFISMGAGFYCAKLRRIK